MESATMNLLHLILRGWRQRPARTALSIASVAVAIAAVLGTALAQSSVRLGIRRLSAAVDKFPAVEVVSSRGGRFAAAEVPKLSGVSGVLSTVPVASRATMARAGGKKFRTVLIGLPLADNHAWDALSLVDGNPVTKSGQAVLSADIAKSLGVKLGSKVTVLTRRGPKSTTIVGIADSGALAAFAPAASLAMPLDDVQSNFQLKDEVDRVRVLLASTDDRDAVQTAVAARLPQTLSVQTSSTPSEMIDSTLRSTELALRLAGALSMAMAAFIILNTLRLNFSERRRDFAVVRVLGATRRQLVELLVLEGFTMGAIGSLLGVPLGLLVGLGLEHAMAGLLGLEAIAPEMPIAAILLALVLGPLVATLAALVPAMQTRGVSASDAMGEMELRRGEHFPLWAAGLGVAAWCLASLLVLLVVRQQLPPEAAIPAGLLMLVAFVTILPAVVGPIIRGATWLFSPWLRTEGQLGSEQLLARSTRTGLTVGVLVVALSSGLGLGTAIINNVDDVRNWYRRSLPGDVFLTNPAATDESTAEARDVGALVSARDDVERVVELRILSARLTGVSANCIVRDFAPEVELPWVLSADANAELRSKLKAGEIVLSSVMAEKIGLASGDALRLEVQGRVFSLRVAATVNDYFLGGRVAYLDQATAAKMLNLGPASFMIVQARPGVDGDQLSTELEKLLAEDGIVVQSFSEMRRQLDGLIDGVVGALWGLLGVGFVIGGVAVSNTLTLNVLEQTRELGLLRIIGMTPGQTRRLVLCESLLLGLLGALMGTLGGITTAVVIHLCNEPVLGRSIPFTLHPWLLAANAGGCLIIALVAAWRPGVWASKLNVLSAIAYE
jgi:putative ABC transport system permease protein